MIRKSNLALLGVLALASGFLAIPAGAGSARRTSSTQKVFRSFKCRSRVIKYDPRTWACTTVTVDPSQAVSGDTTTITYSYTAKAALKYDYLCFSKIIVTNKIDCAYSHKYRGLRKGATITRTYQMTVPTVNQSGGYKLDNYAHFYKRQKLAASGRAYWLANSYICIAMPSEPNACSG